MRTLITNMLAAALLVFGAASASAFNITMTSSYDGVTVLGSSDTITVNVFLDAPTSGLQTLSVSVIVDSSALAYDAAASTALPINYPAPAVIYGTTGNQPGYILYSTVPVAMASAVAGLYPQQTPFQTWPAPPAGSQQVNINLANAGFVATSATGNNIWLSSLVFHVIDAENHLSSTEIEVSVSNGGNTVFANSVEQKGSTTTSAPIQVNLPEPTTALLIGFGLLGLGLAGRRKD
jgi:hypothetical protein